MVKRNDSVILGPGVHLNIPALIAGRLLIQANSGGGKSYTGRKIMEVTYGHVQQIIIDVDGEYHTLREQFFDYMLFGNDNADYPIDVKTAALLARRLLETRVNAIIDLYELGSNKAAFVKPFLESLVQSPRSLWHPVLVFVDEAHRFCPEKDHAISKAAVEDLMTLGRKRGFTGVLMTQRISKLSKDAAAECNNKLIGRSSLDIDMKRSADEIGLSTREDVRSLRKLTAGKFYAIGNAFNVDGDTDLIQIGKVKTTHLSAGETRSVKPAAASKRIRAVFDKFEDLPVEAVEEAKTVEGLKLQLRELREKLAKRPDAETIVEEKTTTIVAKASLDRIEKLYARQDTHVDKLGKALADLAEKYGTSAKSLTASIDKLKTEVHPAMIQKNGAAPTTVVQAARVRLPEAARKLVEGKATAEAPGSLKGGLAEILSTLIQHKERGCTTKQLAVITGYKSTSRYEYLRQLKSYGFVSEVNGQFFATTQGMKAMPNVEPLPTGSRRREIVLGRLNGGPHKILSLLIEAYPESLTSEALGERTGYKSTSLYEYTRQLAASELITTNRGVHRASVTLFDS